MKIELSKILDLLRELNPLLQAQYKVETLELFGSYTKNKQKSNSDLDLLVTFKETPSLLKFIELENFLSDRIGVKVDLVIRDDIKPRLRHSILKHSILV